MCVNRRWRTGQAHRCHSIPTRQLPPLAAWPLPHLLLQEEALTTLAHTQLMTEAPLRTLTHLARHLLPHIQSVTNYVPKQEVGVRRCRLCALCGMPCMHMGHAPVAADRCGGDQLGKKHGASVCRA